MNERRMAAGASDILARLLARCEHELTRAEAGAPSVRSIDAIALDLHELRTVRDHVLALHDEEALLNRTKADLRQTQDRLQSLVDEMPIVLWAVDPVGIITLSEGRALQALGLRGGELVGASVFDVYAEFPEAIDAIRFALQGVPHGAEVDVGGTTWSNRYFPQIDSDGRVVALTGLSIDITASKRLEEETRILEEQMRHAQKLESLGVLAGGIAHDFNNLLAVILGNLEMAERQLDAASAALPRVKSAERAAVRAAELTHQLLVYAGKSRVKVDAIELNALVLELAQLLATVIAKNASIQYALEPSLPLLDADAAQLRQVVMNLITNASDALEGRTGTISLSTGLVPTERAGHPEPGPSREFVFFEVRDSGVGMDAATIGRIFEPFFTTKFTGRGLGLAAVSGIVRGHRGTLTVTSEPGMGTCFRVVLPASDTISASAPSAQASEGDRGASKSAGVVLLVDDDTDVRRMIRELLGEGGYEVIEAASGQLALRLVDEACARISVALIDIVMPEMNGHQLSAALKDRTTKIPVVLMSGFEQDAPAADSGAPHIAPVLAKPFSADSLMAALRSARREDAP